MRACVCQVVRLPKPNVTSRVGLRFGLHPSTKQVCIVELYSNYPALESGKLFVGDVITKINGVKVTHAP